MAINPMHEYSQWLYNRYVEMTNGSLPEMGKYDFAQIMREALQKHLQSNLQRKGLGLPRKFTKELLRDIDKFKKDPIKYSLYYVGEHSKKLAERDDRFWKEKYENWENDDQAISILSATTEIKVIKLLAKTIKNFEQLRNLKMTSHDDACACGAANLLFKILWANGYEIDRDPGSRKLLNRTSLEI